MQRSSGFPVISGLTPGKCGTQISVPLELAPVYRAYLFYTATEGPAPDEVNAVLSRFTREAGAMPGAVFNAQKNALALIYAGQIDSLALAGSFAAQIATLVNQAVCWVSKSRAYQGPCADLLLATARVVRQALVALDNDLGDAEAQELLTVTNEQLAKLPGMFNCCGFTQLELSVTFPDV